MSSVRIIPERILPDDAQSNPHHRQTKDGVPVVFKNPHPSFGVQPNLWLILKEALRLLWQGKLKRPDNTPPTVTVRTPDFTPSPAAAAASSSSSSSSPTQPSGTAPLRATWLGHACYHVVFPSGLRVLFDPVFERCCGPYGRLGPARFTQVPCQIKDLPPVDAVVISHSHYDHLSDMSCKELQKHNPDVHFFVGLNLKKWFNSMGVKNVTELDWWQDAELTVKRTASHPATTTEKPKQQGDNQAEEDNASSSSSAALPEVTARISCLPAQHNSARGLFDKDTTLWASWAVKSGGKSVWFGGDTGYRRVPRVAPGTDDWDLNDPVLAALPRCPQFAQIGQLRGPFDLGLIPIGAYNPRVVFSAVHSNPFDAVEIFKDTKCRKAMAIHWGTWSLTWEEVLEPPRLLKQAMKKSGLDDSVFDTCEIGESRDF